MLNVEIEENMPRGQVQSGVRRHLSVLLTILIIIILILYVILSFINGKQSVDPQHLIKLAIALAPVKEEWNQTRS